MNGEQEEILYLLKKRRRGIGRLVFSRAGLIALMLLTEIALLFLLFFRAAETWPPILGGSTLLSLLVVLYLLNIQMDPTAKITWLIVIALFPVFGALLFAYTRSDLGHRLLRQRVAAITQASLDKLPVSYPAKEAFCHEAPRAAALVHYLGRSGCYPVYNRANVTYLPSGEVTFEAILAELERAERFIFLEYFIIAEGEMWGRILSVLARKAKEGVEVRLIYDGTCSFSTLSHDYPKRLAALGIRAKSYAPITPFVSTYYNYRDHRKILVVDGRVAFTGGVNLADEYINKKPRFGHWKDSSVMLAGDAVASFTRMFLDMWRLGGDREEEACYLRSPEEPAVAGGYVIPYGDCPLDNYKVGERVYLDILNRAERYVHIMTPYLILDGEMENALIYAAERGVEVSLLLPGIPDKKMPYALAKTYYPALLAAGVHIYEYTPGFLHAKVFVADDREAVVGTINLDYRSFYHHFECAAYLHNLPCIKDMEADFSKTRALSRAVCLEDLRKEKLSFRLVGILMKGIAPLV